MRRTNSSRAAALAASNGHAPTSVWYSKYSSLWSGTARPSLMARRLLRLSRRQRIACGAHGLAALAVVGRGAQHGVGPALRPQFIALVKFGHWYAELFRRAADLVLR